MSRAAAHNAALHAAGAIDGDQDLLEIVAWDPVAGKSRSILKGHGAAVTALA